MVTMSASKAPGPAPDSSSVSGNAKQTGAKPKLASGVTATDVDLIVTDVGQNSKCGSGANQQQVNKSSSSSVTTIISRVPIGNLGTPSFRAVVEARAGGPGVPPGFVVPSYDECPNQIVYRKMEKIMEKLQDEKAGIRVRTVKSLRSKIPSVFTGAELISWMQRNLNIEDQADCLQLACLMAAHGYFFPIDDHALTVKADGTYYRFQTPYYWPSNSWEPENTDYAVYLCKRTMQNKTKMGLADYEAENLARLQRMFSRKWEFIFMQAEAQAKVDKRRDKMERKILDSQERAFWDVHRPAPGCVNTTELDVKKACRMNSTKPSLAKWAALVSSGTNTEQKAGAPMTVSAPTEAVGASAAAVAGGSSTDADERGGPLIECKEEDVPANDDSVDFAVEYQKQEIKILQKKLERLNLKVAKATESFLSYYSQYNEYDPFVSSLEPPNPWVSDSTDYWDQEKLTKDISVKRVKRWAFGIHELLRDPAGKEQFYKFLEKEYSDENLRFWDDVQALKMLSAKDVPRRCQEIWDEYMKEDSSSTINIDAKALKTTKENLLNPDRWTFEDAASHVLHLMRNDTYSRYLRSDMYKDYLAGCKKKTTKTLFIPVFSNLNLGSSSNTNSGGNSNTGQQHQQQASSGR